MAANLSDCPRYLRSGLEAIAPAVLDSSWSTWIGLFIGPSPYGITPTPECKPTGGYRRSRLIAGVLDGSWSSSPCSVWTDNATNPRVAVKLPELTRCQSETESSRMEAVTLQSADWSHRVPFLHRCLMTYQRSPNSNETRGPRGQTTSQEAPNRPRATVKRICRKHRASIFSLA